MSEHNQLQRRLIWIDMEMSGLDPKIERILEIAIVVTDWDLNQVADPFEVVVLQEIALLNDMDAWNTEQHEKSGLCDEVLKSTIDESSAENLALEFLKKLALPSVSPMCGHSVHQDRRFLLPYMPRLHNFFHYRNLDVSTVRMLAHYWNAPVEQTLVAQRRQDRNKSAHRALSDILSSIEELKYWRAHFLHTTENNELSKDLIP